MRLALGVVIGDVMGFAPRLARGLAAADVSRTRGLAAVASGVRPAALGGREEGGVGNPRGSGRPLARSA